MKKKIFINQQKLETSLVSGQISLEGSLLRPKDMAGYYQLIPAIKFTSCVSNSDDPLGYVGKYAPLALFEQKGIEVNMHSIDYSGETFEVEEGFIGNYSNEKQPDVSPDSKKSSKNGADYDPTLIKKLNEDHKTLLTIFTEIKKAVAEDNYVTMNGKLLIFGNKLRIHLLTEHIKFHTYLEDALKNSSVTRKMSSTLQEKITSIGQTALSFIQKYQGSDWTDKTKKSFRRGLEELGVTLNEHIDMEEDLYGLYLPKSAYDDAI